MKISRDYTNIINWVLDNIIPPIVRDSRFFMYPLFWILFKKKSDLFMSFKKNVSTIHRNKILDYYKELSDVHIKRETDLNSKSVDFILDNISGDTVLDIACGRGYLAKRITEKLNCKVVGVDFNISNELLEIHSDDLNFIEGDVTKIPFPDNSFDTVTCTHTLEHVLDIQQGIRELRRVCKRKLIVVLPKQREYKYTFDLHLHFFPYKYSVLNLMNNTKGTCLNINNDWVYFEEMTH